MSESVLSVAHRPGGLVRYMYQYQVLARPIPSGPASRHFHHFRYVQQYCGFLDHVQKFTDSCNARNIPYCFFSQDLKIKIPLALPGVF